VSLCKDDEDLNQKAKLVVMGDYLNTDTRIMLACL
jgi:hypothetical protein